MLTINYRGDKCDSITGWLITSCRPIHSITTESDWPPEIFDKHFQLEIFAGYG